LGRRQDRQRYRRRERPEDSAGLAINWAISEVGGRPVCGAWAGDKIAGVTGVENDRRIRQATRSIGQFLK